MGSTINVAIYLSEELDDKYRGLGKDKQRIIKDKVRVDFKESLK